MNERQYMQKFKASLTAKGIWCYIIPDHDGFGNSPFDMFSVHKGVFAAWEGKLLKKPSAFGVYHMREHQISSLTTIVNNGGKAFVPLFIDSEKVVVVFDWEMLVEHWAEHGSLKKKEIERYIEEVGIRLKKGIFKL